MKKVLFVATVARQHIMQFHLPYLKMFQELGYQVEVAAKNDFLQPEDTIPYCDTFYELNFSRNPLAKENYQALKQLEKIIREGNYEIIHCHTPVAAALTRLACKKVKKQQGENWHSKVMYTAHGFHFFKGAPLINWLIYYPIEKYLAKSTDVLITINQEDYKRAEEKFSPKKLYYVPGVGVDFSRFSSPKMTKEAVKESLGIPQNHQVILSVGELNTNKNHRKIIEALATIPHDQVTYVIAGLGNEKEALTKLALEKQVSLKLLGYRKDVPELLNASDIYAFPSIREGLSLSLMEAMSSGKAIIASNIRGNHDLITSNENGILFSLESSPETIGKELAVLLNHPEIQKEYGKVAQEKVQTYALSNVLPMMKKIYFS